MESTVSTGTGPLTFRQTLVIFIGLQLGQVMSSIDGTIVATALPTIADDIGGFSRVDLGGDAPTRSRWSRRCRSTGSSATSTAGDACCSSPSASSSSVRWPAGRRRRWTSCWRLGSSRASAAAVSAPSPWRRSPTSSRPGSSAGGSGYQGVIFAVASAVGPIVGGLFVEHLSWRWAFLINLPIGAGGGDDRRRPACGSPTAASRTPSTAPAPPCSPRAWRSSCCSRPSAAMRSRGGRRAPSPLIAPGRAARRAVRAPRAPRPEPVLPLALFAQPGAAGVPPASTSPAGCCSGAGSSSSPSSCSRCADVSPTRSGLVLMPLMFGAAFGTLVTGRLVARTGRYRAWPIAGRCAHDRRDGSCWRRSTSSSSVLAVALSALAARHRRRVRACSRRCSPPRTA